MANYLVTGAAGFIASSVISMLLAEGHRVVGLDDLNDSYDPLMKLYRLEQLKSLPGFTFYAQDICNLPPLQAIFALHAPIDAVIHLAARAGVRQSVENPWAFVDTNINGALNLFECCRIGGIPKMVLASTSGVYGANPPIPTTEDADTSHPLQPYAATKKAAETLAYSYHHLFGLDVTIFRYFTVYGPQGRPDMFMFRFAQWIAEGRPVRVAGDGTQSRGVTYLDDIARGTILGLKPLGYEIINLGGHQSISLNAVIQRFEDMLGRKAIIETTPRHPADIWESQANVEKAGRLLGWEPRVTLEVGLPNLVNWYLQERGWASQVLTP